MTTQPQPSKVLNISLWIVQVILAAMFLMAGIMKSTTPIDTLAETLPWADQVPAALVRFIGLSELIAAIGLLLPSLMRIKPFLTPLGAGGLALIMLIAAVFHISRGEAAVIGINLAIAALALFVAWGRWKKVPIKAK